MAGSPTAVTGTRKQVFFPSGSILYKEGDKAEGAYLILTGEVATSMGSAPAGSLPVSHIQPPAYLALVDSIAGENYSCTSMALRDTRGVFIPRDELMVSFSSPEEKLTLLRALAEEVSDSYEELRTVRDKYCGRSGNHRHYQ